MTDVKLTPTAEMSFRKFQALKQAEGILRALGTREVWFGKEGKLEHRGGTPHEQHVLQQAETTLKNLGVERLMLVHQRDVERLPPWVVGPDYRVELAREEGKVRITSHTLDTAVALCESSRAWHNSLAQSRAG